MKKIKTKIINSYNQYLLEISSILKNIKIKINKLIRYFAATFKSIFFFIVYLEFMKNSKVNISIFNRYLIFSIFILFSYLFYLSIPTLYNYGDLQKYLTKKVHNEFNLNSSLSANITYKILPTPNFEISNVLLNTNNKEKLNDYAQVKKMKIYVSIKNLHNQNKIKVKKIVISEVNFNINKISYNYLNNFLKEKISKKKIKIKKSKLFFTENNPEKSVVALSTINNSDLFFDEKKNNIQLNIDGSIFNTKYNLVLLRNIYKKNTTKIKVKLRKLNTLVESTFYKKENKTGNDEGKFSVNFSGSEINTKYKILDKLIILQSEKSKLNNKNIKIKGKVNISPFYYDLNIDLEKIDLFKIMNDLSNFNNLLDKKILLNKNFNGKITFNIRSIKGMKIFNKAKIVSEITNEQLIFSNSNLISNKIGKLSFSDSFIEVSEGKKFLKSKILFEIFDQKKFYQKLQIPKSKRIKLNNIYFEIEKDFKQDEINITKFFFNVKKSNNSSNKPIEITNLLNMDEVNNLKNWIELKKFSNQIFSDIENIN